MAQFDDGICRLHSNRIEEIDRRIAELEKLVRGNGNSGHSIRIHDMEVYLSELKELEKERKETSQRMELINLQNLQATKRGIYLYIISFFGMLILYFLTFFFNRG